MKISAVAISRVNAFNTYMKSKLVHKSQRQLVKFAIIGTINTILDVSIYFALSRYIGYFSTHRIGAKGIAFTFGSLSSYLCNRHWTFNQTVHVHFKEALRFYIIVGIGIVINTSSLYFALNFIHIYDLLGVIFATCISFVWNFLMSKYFVFTNKNK